MILKRFSLKKARCIFQDFRWFSEFQGQGERNNLKRNDMGGPKRNSAFSKTSFASVDEALRISIGTRRIKSRWHRQFSSYIPVHREDTTMRCDMIVLFVPMLLCLNWHNNNPKKRGKSWRLSALYLAPESDEWEEIECDEVIQNIAINIHVCPHQQLGRISIFKIYICQVILYKVYDNNYIN